MLSIWKFELAVTDAQDIVMPRESEILCVQIQFGKPCLWAKVDDTLSTESRQILTYGTGHVMIDKTVKYIGSYQLDGGMLVYHVFDDRP